MSECEKLGKTFLPVTRAESLNGSCLIDFKDPELKSEVESLVECEDRCSMETDYDTPEYKECVEECTDTIDKSVAGSVVVDKKTLEVKESTIPVSCSVFMEENEYGELEFTLEKENEIVERLSRAGCEAMEIGWMHPHEFLPSPHEWEEEPAICYVHVKSKAEGKCKLPKVLKILGMEKQQSSMNSFLETV